MASEEKIKEMVRKKIKAMMGDEHSMEVREEEEQFKKIIKPDERSNK